MTISKVSQALSLVELYAASNVILLSLKKQVIVLYEYIHAVNLMPDHPLQELTNLYGSSSI